jgi:hypothetical protein
MYCKGQQSQPQLSVYRQFKHVFQYQHSSAYSATKAHKINHSFQPNCEWVHADHPCYGRIPAVRTIQVSAWLHADHPCYGRIPAVRTIQVSAWLHADHSCYGRIPAVRTIQVSAWLHADHPCYGRIPAD